MGKLDLEKAKDLMKETGKKTIDGLGSVQKQMSSITESQLDEIRGYREQYYSKLDSDDNIAITKMNEYAMDIYKSYLSEMTTKYSPVSSTIDINTENRIRYFDITKWVIDSEEIDVEKLINVYQVLSNQDCSIALIYNRDVLGCRVSMAVSNIGISDSPDIADQFVERIQKSIKGNFPGAQMSNVSVGSPLMSHEIKDGEDFYYSIASVSNLVSDKSEDFISQSMEKLLDGIVPEEGKEYSLVLLATPCWDVETIKDNMSIRYSELSAFSQWQSNTSVSEGKMIGAGANIGANVGVNFGISAGVNIAKAVNNMSQLGKNEGVTRTYTNYAVKHLLDTIEKQNNRLEECDALGMWNFAAYAISSDPNIAEDVAHMYLSLTQGTDSFMSKAAINLWEGGIVDENDSIITILNDVCVLRHPRFVAYSEKEQDYAYPLEKDLTTILSGKDLAKALNFPHCSVAGLPVVESVSFGREVYKNEEQICGAKLIDIGCVYHMHSKENKRIQLDVDSLCSHTFVSGSTGKGKSNTVYKILEQVCAAKRHEEFSFMVVEPAKGEYKDAFWKHPSIATRVLGTNPKKSELLRINPFSFPEDIHVLEHIDRLAEIFNACWPMYAAMPAILKSAIIRAYESCGWDMTNSENDSSTYPGFIDVLEQIKYILRSSDFSDNNKGDYTGALCTRVESLTTGLNGMIFSGNDYISDDELFNHNIIIDLSRIGAPETKSLIMSLLVMKLQEYRMSENKGANLPLRHLTVLEEAHNILKRTSTEQSVDSSNVQGKAVEVISNAIAEMRTYGEGFVIADQAPGLLDISVIRNTNTKIVLCLPEEEDRQIVGRAIGLSEKQVYELARLERGVAAVYQNDWQEAVLCKFDKYHKDYSYEEKKAGFPSDKQGYKFERVTGLKTVTDAKREVLVYLLSKIINVDSVYNEEMKNELVETISLCGLTTTSKSILRKVVREGAPNTIEEAAPYIASLYDVNCVLDNTTSSKMDEWNRQVLDRLDPHLNDLEQCYQDSLIKCLMHEQTRINSEFRIYEEVWESEMRKGGAFYV